MRSPFIFGPPKSHFDLALLWELIGLAQRREPNDKDKDDYGNMVFHQTTDSNSSSQERRWRILARDGVLSIGCC
jgi:hypothetical protein